jgi:hypothetical protein
MPKSDTVPRSGLSRAVRAEDCDGLARRDVDVDAAHGVNRTERLLQAGHRDPGRRFRSQGGGLVCGSHASMVRSADPGNQSRS